MKIACTTIYDARNPGAFGGRGYYMMQALEVQPDRPDIHYLGPLPRPQLFTYLARAKQRYYDARNRRYTPQRDRILVRHFAHQIDKKLRLAKPDLILSPESPGSQPIAYSDTRKPIVIWTDATLAAVMESNPNFGVGRLAAETIRDGLDNEREALNRCALLLCKSDWTARTALEHYQLPRSMVKVALGGPHIPRVPSEDEIRTMVSARSPVQCTLVLIGYSWERKGGDFALQVTRELNRSGLATQLIVIGCEPGSDVVDRRHLRLVGRIDKNTQEGRVAFESLLSQSHFQILPTHADCAPNVIAEGNAFALPCLASDVGGISTIIRSGKNGEIFPETASVESYCSYISQLFHDYSSYEHLAMAAYQEYRHRLSWEAIGKDVMRELEQLI